MVGGRSALWRRCQTVVDRLDLPDPFDAESFIATLARKRGRPIELIAVPARPDRPCGLLVTTARTDLIIYSHDTSAVHRQHILLHEAAHLVCGHDSTGAASDAGLGALLPHLSPALIRGVLGRTVYTEPQEREAELIATLIHHRVARGRPAPARPAPRFGIETMLGLRDDSRVRQGSRDGLQQGLSNESRDDSRRDSGNDSHDGPRPDLGSDSRDNSHPDLRDSPRDIFPED